MSYNITTIISLKPLITSTYNTYYKHTISIVAHPIFDEKLIDFVNKYNLQMGDNLDKKWKQSEEYKNEVKEHFESTKVYLLDHGN